jgi:predicted ArsR family transcriptional regulator
MQLTRQQILTYLQNHPWASAGEISRSLSLTSANIRYHLGFLKENGLVQVSGKRSPGGAGRPIKLYNLTPRVLGTNINPLLKALLELIAGKSSAERDFQQAAERLIGNIELIQGNRINRFNQAIEILNQHHYHASWEAHPTGPQVLLRHCPYHDLAQDHPELCQMDTKLVSLLFDTSLEITEKRSFDKDPYSPCVFEPG